MRYDNGDSLGVTGTHPLYSLDRQQFIPVEDLRIGEKLLSKSGIVTLTEKTYDPTPQEVYNLEVGQWHNFLVGKSGVVAHNSYVEEIKKALSSGVKITKNTESEAVLLGGWNRDLDHVLNNELKQVPLTLDEVKVLDNAGLIEPLGGGKGLFSAAPNQKYNLLHVTKEAQLSFEGKGGFFNRFNAKWVDIAVTKERPIYLVSHTDELYKFENGVNVITGYGKEVHRLEWLHNYRFDPISKKMLPPTHPSYSKSLGTLTKEVDHKIVTMYKK